jgi:hypothetical protein
VNRDLDETSKPDYTRRRVFGPIRHATVAHDHEIGLLQVNSSKGDNRDDRTIRYGRHRTNTTHGLHGRQEERAWPNARIRRVGARPKHPNRGRYSQKGNSKTNRISQFSSILDHIRKKILKKTRDKEIAKEREEEKKRGLTDKCHLTL